MLRWTAFAPGIGLRPCRRADKRLAIVLSSYPGRPHQIAHAVGLDALASTEALARRSRRRRLRCRADRSARRRRLAASDADLERRRLSRRAGEASASIAGQSGERLGRAGGRSASSRRRIPFRGDRARQGRHRGAARARRGATPRRRLSRSLAHSAPRLCRVLSLAPEQRHPCADPYGRAWHAGMAARQVGRAVRRVLAGGADRRCARDLSLHRQRSRRGRAGQAPHRRRHHRPSAAAACRERLAARISCGSSNCSTNIPPPTGSIRRGVSALSPRSATRRALRASRTISALRRRPRRPKRSRASTASSAI